MKINRREFTRGLIGTAGALALGPFNDQPHLRVNGPRISENLNALAEFGKNPQGGVSRVAYSELTARGASM